MKGLNQFLKHDPNKILGRYIEILNSYNDNKGFIPYIKFKQWWIMHISYPWFKRSIDVTIKNTLFTIYLYPKTFIIVVIRYMIFVINYCKSFGYSIDKLLDLIFPDRSVSIKFDTDRYDNENFVTKFHIHVESNTPSVLYEGLKYTITNLEADTDTSYLTIEQTIYDCNNKDIYSTANVISRKYFRLGEDGDLYNPNYKFDEDLYKNDMIVYKMAIAHILSVLCGIMDSVTNIKFSK